MTAFGLILIAMMTLGASLLVTAGLVYLAHQTRERRTLVARRYSGAITALGARDQAKRTVTLVSREKDHIFWRIAGISPAAFNSFREDQSRLAGFAIAVAAPLGIFGVSRLFGLGIGLALLATTALALAGAVAAVRLHSRRRASQIEARLAEALDVVARCLRIGMPVSAALRVVSRDLSGPIAQEFAMVADRVSYGKDLVSAMRDMAERGQSPTLRFFSAAIAVQIETGGNLVEVIERLARLARERTQLQRKITAMTAEAKWSGRFLSVFPIVASVGIALINPDYFSNVWDKPYLVPLSFVIGALLIGNIIFMQKLVRFE